MAAGFQYFDSTMSGAPLLTGQAGKMIALLDWVLVDKGGWTKAFTGTNLAVYRSDSGNRFCLRADDTQAMYTRMRGYRAMTAISTGTNLFPPTAAATASGTGYGIQKSTAANALSRRYWGIRTNRFVMLFVEHTNHVTEGVGYKSALFFGDVPSLCEADPFNTIIWAGNPSYGYNWPDSYWVAVNAMIASVSNPVAAMAASPSGARNSPMTLVNGVVPAASFTYAAAPASAAGRLQHMPWTVYCAEADWNQNGEVYARARIPNLRHAMGHAPRPGLATGEVIIEGGRHYVVFPHTPHDPMQDGGANYAGGFCLLEISDTDGAL